MCDARMRSVLCILLVTSTMACAAQSRRSHMERKRERLRHVADQFVAAWMRMSKFKGRREACEFQERAFNRSLTGWYYKFRCYRPKAMVYVSEHQGIVTSFFGTEHELRTPSWSEGRQLSEQERVQAVKRKIKIPMVEARKLAERFAVEVYPRFRGRDFVLSNKKLAVGYATAFRFTWIESFDAGHPKAFPNRLTVEVNPVSGIVVSYEATNYLLPEGFRIALTSEQALEKANASMKRMLERSDLQLVKEPNVSPVYVVAKEESEEDRICWMVLYVFKVGRSRRCESRLFDVTTGELMDNSALDE